MKRDEDREARSETRSECRCGRPDPRASDISSRSVELNAFLGHGFSGREDSSADDDVRGVFQMP